MLPTCLRHLSPTFTSELPPQLPPQLPPKLPPKKKFTPTKQQQSFPTNNTREEKLRKIGRLLVNMAKDELIVKSPNGKKWKITEKGEKELY